MTRQLSAAIVVVLWAGADGAEVSNDAGPIAPELPLQWSHGGTQVTPTVQDSCLLFAP